MGTVAAILLLAGWLGSRWWYCWYVTNYGVVFNGNAGRISIGDSRGYYGIQTGWTMIRNPYPEFRLWFEWSRGGPVGALPNVAIPLWMPAVLLAAWSGATWRRHLRVRGRAARGACASCGYDLEGLPPGTSCPECGGALRG